MQLSEADGQFLQVELIVEDEEVALVVDVQKFLYALNVL